VKKKEFLALVAYGHTQAAFGRTLFRKKNFQMLAAAQHAGA
jgi:hypothetical protein